MFNSFISLGWFCGTTNSLSRYGLREFSSPFDWCFSELYGVMHFLETDFSDFMDKNNLELIENNPLRFIDKKWRISFIHDVKSDFYKEYTDIFTKYNRRISKLSSYISKGRICFIRAVKNQQEIEYIINNSTYIENVIKKKNKDNDIIFLIPYYMSVPSCFTFTHYKLEINTYIGNYYIGLRSLFDTNQEFISYCKNNYDVNKMTANLVFDLEKVRKHYSNGISPVTIEKSAINEINDAFKTIRLLEGRFQRLLAISKCDFEKVSMPSKVVIYGADDIGKLLYDKIHVKTEVLCFIDRDPSKMQYCGKDIVLPQNFKPTNFDFTIIVVSTDNFDEIISNIPLVCNTSKINFIRIEDFLSV